MNDNKRYNTSVITKGIVHWRVKWNRMNDGSFEFVKYIGFKALAGTQWDGCGSIEADNVNEANSILKTRMLKELETPIGKQMIKEVMDEYSDFTIFRYKIKNTRGITWKK